MDRVDGRPARREYVAVVPRCSCCAERHPGNHVIRVQVGWLNKLLCTAVASRRTWSNHLPSTHRRGHREAGQRFFSFNNDKYGELLTYEHKGEGTVYQTSTFLNGDDDEIDNSDSDNFTCCY